MTDAGAVVDLRSDTVTRPTPGMRRAMMEAEVGDDVFGDDPTVNRLQARMAELFGFEAALLFPSGTQSNLAALMTHCGRGDEVILGRDAHTFRYEAGGAAVLGSIHSHPIDNRADGTIDLDAVAAAVKPDDVHFPRTRLLALENTINGRPLPPGYVAQARERARAHGLAMHLDGARIFNAATAQRVAVHVLCRGVDSVSVCLSKGLGAPVGTVLLGSRAFVAAATRVRKILGGGMRQAGVLAAAGLYALDHHVERLAIDHEHARRLAAGLERLGVAAEQHTNMVFASFGGDPDAVAARLAAHGVLVLPGRTMRLVTHLDVDADGIDRALQAFERCRSGG